MSEMSEMALLKSMLQQAAERDHLTARTASIYEQRIEQLFQRSEYPTGAAFGADITQQPSTIMALTDQIPNLETRMMTVNALCKLVKYTDAAAFDYYNRERARIREAIIESKLDNTAAPGDYLDYDVLMRLPQDMANDLARDYGAVFVSKPMLEAFSKGRRRAYLRVLFDYIALHLCINYPLRLIWPTVGLSPDDPNHLVGNILYLREFKNHRLLGNQSMKIDPTTTALLRKYLTFLRDVLGEQPGMLLYRVGRVGIGPYASPAAFGIALRSMFARYAGIPQTMNQIRHIVESHLMQSAGYARMTNRQKAAAHARLLHSTITAQTSYNKIVPDVPQQDRSTISLCQTCHLKRRILNIQNDGFDDQDL